MGSSRFARVTGLLLLVLGAAGFVPPLIAEAQGGPIATDTQHGLLFGLLPVSIARNGLYLLLGAWGFAAARSSHGALLYARSAAIVFALLTAMGVVPGLDDLSGTMPLYGNAIWLHAGLAATAAYFGWAHRHGS